ncbi:MAG: SH3 domain-containing protein, partial [Gammaproteobacteria bacterium]|nr:SH3 domain-containing protein [Gammaproteobacteria bacterium]
TGPGAGYPILYVVERGGWIRILKRKTDWFKVRTPDNKEGWVDRVQMAETLTPAGKKTAIKTTTQSDFAQRRWEMGVLGGDFDGADVITTYGAFAFNRSLSTELTYSQVLGNFSDSNMFLLSLLSQPFPEWRVSPFFTLGGGTIKTSPNVTLVQAQDREDALAKVGFGVRAYLTRRFMLRAELNNYVIFSSDNNNEEIDEWKIGFAFFF